MENGTRVKVTYEGTLVEAFVNKSGRIEYTVHDSTGTSHWYSEDAIEVEELGPEGWPPRQGDVWEKDGELWFVYTSIAGVPTARSEFGFYSPPEKALDSGERKLIHRKK